MASGQGIVTGAEVLANPSIKSDETKGSNADCFTAHCALWTERGLVKAKNIQVGDRLMTKDGGFQPIIFVHRQMCSAQGHNRPVHFAKGSIGNSQETRVSQLHLVHTASARKIFKDLNNHLVPAVDLLGFPGVTLDEDTGVVLYFHFLLPENHLICADGVWSASWNPSRDCFSKDKGLRQKLEAALGHPIEFQQDAFQHPARPYIRRQQEAAVA